MTALVLLMTLGAATLAFWIDSHWEGLAPQRTGVQIVHVLVSLTAAQFVAPELMETILSDDRTLGLEMVALFAIFLPSLVYVFLSGIWILRRLHGALQTYR